MDSSTNYKFSFDQCTIHHIFACLTSIGWSTNTSWLAYFPHSGIASQQPVLAYSAILVVIWFNHGFTLVIPCRAIMAAVQSRWCDKSSNFISLLYHVNRVWNKPNSFASLKDANQVIFSELKYYRNKNERYMIIF